MFAAVRSLKEFVLSRSSVFSRVQKSVGRCMSIEGKCALVTDGTSGTGAAVARELLRNRASNVIITGPDEQLGKAKAAEMNECYYGRGIVEFRKTNTRDVFELENTFNYIKENFKSLDIFFNNAETKDEKDIIHTDLVFKIQGIVEAYRTMSNGGVILNLISSIGIDVKSNTIDHSAAAGGFIAAAMAFGDAEYFDKTQIRMMTLCTEAIARRQSNEDCNSFHCSIIKSAAHLIENGSNNTLWLCQRNGSLSSIELQDMNRFFVKFEPKIEDTEDDTK